MRRITVALALIPSLISCGSNTAEPVSDSQKTITNYQSSTPSEFSFDPISKYNCPNVNQNIGTPIADYFNAVGQANVQIDDAENALLRIHRQLRCMSALELSRKYPRLMDDILQYPDTWSTRIAPLVYLLTEHGVSYIDGRAKSWLFYYHKEMRDELDLENPINEGMGLLFARGESLIKMNTSQENMAVRAMNSTTWNRVGCSFYRQMFRKTDQQYQVECTTSRCPRFAENIDAGLTIDPGNQSYDTKKFGEICDIAHGQVEGSKSIDDPIFSGGGPGGSYIDQIDDIQLCASQHAGSSGGNDGFTCIVQTAVDNSFDNITGNYGTIKVGFESRNLPGGCAGDPIANIAYPPDEAKAYESDKEHSSEIEKNLIGMRADANLYNLAELGCDNGSNPGACANAAQRYADFVSKWGSTLYEHGFSSDPNLGLDQYENYSDEHDEYMEERYPLHNDDQLCGEAGEGTCSDCSMNDSVIRDTNECMGVGSDKYKDSFNTDGGTGPSPLDPYIYPDPDGVLANPNTSGYIACVAESMGWNDNLAHPDDACAQVILCQGTETGSVSPTGCSCSSRTMAPGMSLADQCSSAMLCSQNSNSCGCNDFNTSLDVPSAGGLPDDSEIYMRMGYEHPEQY